MIRTEADEWRPIKAAPGYEINILGEVRSWRGRWGKPAKPKKIRPYKNSAGAWAVHLMCDGGRKEFVVMALMVDAFLKKPEGMVAYHLNMERSDNRLINIGFATKSDVAKLQMKKNNVFRKTIAKISPDGEIVRYYRSAREAARHEFVSYQTIIDRCYGKVKNPFKLTGFDYRYTDVECGRDNYAIRTEEL